MMNEWKNEKRIIIGQIEVKKGVLYARPSLQWPEFKICVCVSDF